MWCGENIIGVLINFLIAFQLLIFVDKSKTANRLGYKLAPPELLEVRHKALAILTLNHILIVVVGLVVLGSITFFSVFICVISAHLSFKLTRKLVLTGIISKKEQIFTSFTLFIPGLCRGNVFFALFLGGILLFLSYKG